MAQEPHYIQDLSRALMSDDQDDLMSLPEDVELLPRLEEDSSYASSVNNVTAGSTLSSRTPENAPISQPDIVRLFLDEIAGGFPSQSTIDQVLQQYGLDPNTR